MIERVSYYVKALLLSQTGMSGGGHDVRLFDVILARFRRLVSFFFCFSYLRVGVSSYAEGNSNGLWVMQRQFG